MKRLLLAAALAVAAILPAQAQPLTAQEGRLMSNAILSRSPMMMRATEVIIFYNRTPQPLTAQELSLIKSAVMTDDWSVLQATEFMFRMNRQR